MASEHAQWYADLRDGAITVCIEVKGRFTLAEARAVADEIEATVYEGENAKRVMDAAQSDAQIEEGEDES